MVTFTAQLKTQPLNNAFEHPSEVRNTRYAIAVAVDFV